MGPSHQGLSNTGAPVAMCVAAVQLAGCTQAQAVGNRNLSELKPACTDLAPHTTGHNPCWRVIPQHPQEGTTACKDGGATHPLPQATCSLLWRDLADMTEKHAPPTHHTQICTYTCTHVRTYMHMHTSCLVSLSCSASSSSASAVVCSW